MTTISSEVFFFSSSLLLLCPAVKPDPAVDDWEAIATDEEKGEEEQ